MVMYRVQYSKKSLKAIPKLKAAHLDKVVIKLIEMIKNDPYQTPPTYEKLLGDLKGLYSRRINKQHRLVYSINEEAKTIRIISMWTHYEE